EGRRLPPNGRGRRRIRARPRRPHPARAAAGAADRRRDRHGGGEVPGMTTSRVDASVAAAAAAAGRMASGGLAPGGLARSAHAAAMGAPDDLDRCPLMPTYGAPAVMFVRGEGSWLWDRDGTRYLDLLSGLAVTGLGHAHPEVA